MGKGINGFQMKKRKKKNIYVNADDSKEFLFLFPATECIHAFHKKLLQ